MQLFKTNIKIKNMKRQFLFGFLLAIIAIASINGIVPKKATPPPPAAATAIGIFNKSDIWQSKVLDYAKKYFKISYDTDWNNTNPQNVKRAVFSKKVLGSSAGDPTSIYLTSSVTVQSVFADFNDDAAIEAALDAYFADLNNIDKLAQAF